MKSLARVLLLLLAPAAPLAAQITPIPDSDFDEAAAQYRSYALGEFQEVVDQWVHAVNADTAAAAAPLYTPDAYVDIGRPARGREAVTELLREWSAEISGLRVGLADFDASGRMAYGMLQVRVSFPEGITRDGLLLLVLRRQGRTWRIRAQSLSML